MGLSVIAKITLEYYTINKESVQYNAKIESGEIVDSIVIPSTPEYNFRWYIPVLIGVDLLAVGGCGTWLYFTFRKKKEVVAE